MSQFIDAMQFRFATKKFVEDKKISEDNFTTIVEAGRLSPSSFGLEPWKFVVVENDELKEKLAPACYNQPQITTGSHIVYILNKREDMKPNSDYLNNLLFSRMPEDGANFVLSFVDKMYNNSSFEKFDMWTKSQCYIPLTNMIMSAAMLGIDSSPMEGFSEEKVLEVLGYSSEDYGVAVVVAFGYRAYEPEEKQRLSFEEVVEFR